MTLELCNVCEMRPNNKEFKEKEKIKNFVHPLQDTSEILIQTNLESQVNILGIAKSKIRNSKNEPYHEGYVVLYSKYEQKAKAEINKELYDALDLVFNSVKPKNIFEFELGD